jgi:hypothetical protein
MTNLKNNNLSTQPTTLSPVSVIKGSKETNLEEVRREIFLIQAKFKFDSSVLNYKEFQLFINGLYQAEGITGVYFPKKDSLRVVFYFSIGQNYSPEAALLFLRLQAILGVGNIKIDFNNTGKIHIRYVISHTDDILNKVIPYFLFIYGQKRLDLAKLHRIYDLSKTLYQNFDAKLASELIHLVYSTNPKGQERQVTLTEKLSIFNCSTEYLSEIALVPENLDLPYKLFIIGFFIGDGSLGFVFDEPKARAPKFYIKILFNFASQKAIDSNVYLLSLVAKSMELEPRIYKKAGSIVTLEYVGETVFKKILPFLSEHREWLY